MRRRLVSRRQSAGVKSASPSRTWAANVSMASASSPLSPSVRTAPVRRAPGRDAGDQRLALLSMRRRIAPLPPVAASMRIRIEHCLEPLTLTSRSQRRGSPAGRSESHRRGRAASVLPPDRGRGFPRRERSRSGCAQFGFKAVANTSRIVQTGLRAWRAIDGPCRARR